MAQTPFNTEEDTDFLSDGYVHTNPVTGKRYVLRKAVASYPYDDQQYNIWLPLGDVTNRTFVGPSDPTSEVDPPNPKNGDLWWDNHQLELRVWHQPMIGNASSGETIPGTGTWISSTHPMADMVTLDGNDKNHTFGNPIIFGEYGTTVFEGKIVDFEIAMPTYTGPDGPPKDPKNPPDDYVDNPDTRRFTYEWSVEPRYNAPQSVIDGLSEDDKKQHENIVLPVGRDDGIAETTDHYRVRIKSGEFDDNDEQYQRSFNVICKLTAKQDDNDLFLPMKVGDDYVLHNLSVQSLPITVINNRKGTALVQFTPKSKKIGDIFDDSDVNAPDTYYGSNYSGENDLVELFDIIYNEGTDIDPDDQSQDVFAWSVGRLTETGSFYTVETPGEINQVPHLVLEYRLATVNELNVYFSYGESGKTYNDHVAQDGFDPKADPTDYDGLTSTALADKYGIKFFAEGFTTQDSQEMPTGQDLIDLYKEPIGGDTVELYTDPVSNIQYVTRKLVINPSSDGGTPNRVYFIGYDYETNTYLPSFHGEIKMKGTRSDEENP